jgi:tetratricopeptide (TPR) repeat protein
MVNYCPQCGNKNEKDYKFCPNCGTALNVTRKSESVIRKDEERIGSWIICNNCGEENPADSYECSSCGIPLKKGKSAGQSSKRAEPREQKVKTEVITSSDKKSLEISKIIPIFTGLVGLVLVILFATGTFESNTESPVTTNPSGVNLAAVQQINELEKRVQAEPANDQLLLELAHLKNDNGFYDRAIEDYKKYLEKNPSDPDARIDMGVCYYNLRQYDTAIQEMQKALEYKPDHQIGHLNLGIVNLAAGRLDESRSWLEKAAAINPDNQIGLRAKELLHNH